MKFILILSSFFCTITFAQDSCLQTTRDEGQVVTLCNESDKENYAYFNCNNFNSCFSGDAVNLINKINSFIFRNGDGAIGDAQIINPNEISFIYGDVGSVCEHKIKRCKY